MTNSVEIIACIGAKLRSLILDRRRVTAAGLGILAGNVPTLQIISLSRTPANDLAISYISMIPSLKVINLSKTNGNGLIHQGGNDLEWIPSLAALQNITSLEWLDLEDTKVSDAALRPLSGLLHLTDLSLKSVFLNDMTLYVLQSLPKLTNLSLRDAVLTIDGIDSFNPPETLKTLDLWGLWLLTEDVLLQFYKRHPQIEVRHELVQIVKSEQDCSISRSQSTLKLSQVKQKLGKMHVSPSRFNNNAFVDQRLKYTREELLALQFSPLSQVSPLEREVDMIFK